MSRATGISQSKNELKTYLGPLNMQMEFRSIWVHNTQMDTLGRFS